MLGIIIEDMRTQSEGLLSQGFWALLVYRVAHRRLRCKIPIIRQLWYIFNRIGQKLIEISTGIMLPESATIGRRLRIEHFGSIIIHGGTIVGDDCIIRQGVTLGIRQLDLPNLAPTLGNRIEVGAGAKLLGGINVGDGATIGANAVVIQDVPAGALAVGVPATIRYRL